MYVSIISFTFSSYFHYIINNLFICYKYVILYIL